MLICIGCSWTYGNEIPETDCFNYAYPVHLGKLLNKKVVNLGMPGGSNENHLVNFITYVANNKIPKDTVAVFQTTEFVRKLGFKQSSLTNYFRGKLVKASDWVDRENYWLSLHTGAPDDKRYKDFGLSWKSYIVNQMCDYYCNLRILSTCTCCRITKCDTDATAAHYTGTSIMI